MYQEQVSFGDAVKRALTVNYCNFDGRSSRSEFWWFYLFNVIINTVFQILLGITDGSNGVMIIWCLIGLAMLLPGLGLGVRRLHDIGKSGWWWFLVLIPIAGPIILIIWWAKNSEMTPNQYGPVPNMTA